MLSLGLRIRNYRSSGGLSGTYRADATIDTRTGFAADTQVPEWGATAAPELEDAVATSMVLAESAGIVVGTYTDATHMTCALSGTLVGDAVSVTGSCGDFTVAFSGTYSGSLSGTFTISGTSRSASEARTLPSTPSGGAVVSLGTAYYVDSVAGASGNAGTSPALPKDTLASIPALVNGDTVRLARGSRWRESINVTADGVSVEAYGIGPRPTVDSGDVLAGWAKTGGLTNVYETTFAPAFDAAGGSNILVLESGIMMIRVEDTATCDTTVGSFVAPVTTGAGSYTVYIHANGSSDPTSDGKTREASSREGGVVLVGTDNTISGIHGRLNAGDDGSLHVRRDGLIYGCVAEWGSLHNVYVRSGSVVRSSVLLWCGNTKPFDPVMGVAYEPDAAGLAPTVWEDNAIIQYDREDLWDVGVGGIFGHNSWDSIEVKNCYFSGLGYCARIDSPQGGTLDVDLCVVEKSDTNGGLPARFYMSTGSVQVRRTAVYAHSAGHVAGVAAVGSNAVGVNVTMQNCIITLPALLAVKCYDGTNLIEHCTFAEEATTGVTVCVGDFSAASQVTFTDNVVSGFSRGIDFNNASGTGGVLESDRNHEALGIVNRRGAAELRLTWANWIATGNDPNSHNGDPVFEAETDAQRPVYNLTDASEALVPTAGHQHGTYAHEFDRQTDQPTGYLWSTFTETIEASAS